jgi:hypothetical protein
MEASMNANKRRWIAVGFVPVAAIALAAVSAFRPARAEGGDPAEKNERCASRLSIAILGKSATADLLKSAAPQSSVDAMLEDPAFVERFSRYINSRFNPEPGETSAEDASYHLTKYLLEKKRPWKELFTGAYDVGANGVVTEDPEGLGYFRSDAWMRRYAGNELAGYRIVAAYRILQNLTGLELQATTNVDGADLTAAGRQAPACANCHYANWYALDKVAKILSKRQGTGDAMRFVPPNEGPQQILGNQTISNDKELVTKLADSSNFKVNVCRTAFNYLYGRDENSCESEVFDKCMTEFETKGTIQSALAVIAKDAAFCQ